MKAVLAAATLILLTADAALAQAPPLLQSEPETVYSAAQRQQDMDNAHRMVETMLAPSFSLDGQYARWKMPVCPHVYGLTPAAATVIERRIREVAAQVGAPVNHDDPCIANIGIIFTVQPQASLLSIAAAEPELLEGGSQKLTVKYPVQAWYAGFKVDYDGRKTPDLPREITEPWRDCIPKGVCDYPWVPSNDSRLHHGVTAEMAAATVLVDTRAVTGMSLGELGDYLALLTLSQAGQYGACQPMATIANLMLKDCAPDDAPHALSHIDIALLTGLYEVPEEPALLQKQRIAGAMRRSLEAQYGKE